MENMNILEKFNIVVACLKANPELIPNRYRNLDKNCLNKLYNSFIKGRELKHPTPPTTTTDKVVFNILEYYFDYPPEQLDWLIQAHKDAMAAENIVGNLLEQFLAQTLEPYGWIWCSGSIIKAVDFIFPQESEWFLLQIKNRDNSENSSSSAIRYGTKIKKWFRSFSKKDEFNWENFPCFPDKNKTQLKQILTEAKFREFIKQKVHTMKINFS